MHKDQVKEWLIELMRQKKSKKFYAQRLGVKTEVIDEILDEIRKDKEVRKIRDEYTEAANYISDLEAHIEVNNDKGTLKSTVVVDFEPKTDQALANLHKIDLTKYKISQYWSKLKSNGKFTSSVFCTLKKQDDFSAEDALKVLENYKSTYKPLTKFDILLNDVYAEPCSAFLDLTDFHLGKRELEGTTIEEKTKIFYSIVDKLLYKTYKAHFLEEIVFIIGSDFYHTDNQTMSPHGNTEKGTVQETTTYWYDEYERGFDLYVTVINKLKQFCKNLKIILVQGNHDRTKSFYVAHALSKYFQNESSINFDIEPKPRKIHVYGQNFIGLHHGDCKINELPLLFAQEFSQQWGPCKFKEIKVGDKHFYMEKEVAGVRIKQLPSLSGTDTWHNQNNFVMSTKAGIISVYHGTKGRVSEFEERIA